MTRYLHRTVSCFAMMLGMAASMAVCRCQGAVETTDARRDTLRAIDQWSCVFADRAISLRYAWDGKSKQVTSGEWQLATGDRVVARGAVRPTFVAAANAGDHVAFSLQMPAVKPGGIVAMKLIVTLHTDNLRSAVHHRPIFIFSSAPFVDRLQWLRELNIQLYDPSGTTARVFEEHGLPFNQLATAAAIDAAPSSILVLGEGSSWKEHSGAIRAARRAAQRGLRVLCLAPHDGEMPLYRASSSDPAEMSSLYCSHEDVIRRFDKRFDTREWPGGSSAVSRLGLVSDNEMLFARVLESSTAWPWIEMRFSDSSTANEKGTMIVCGFGIVKYWNDGPVPRYLLRAVFESLDSQPPSRKEGNPHAAP